MSHSFLDKAPQYLGLERGVASDRIEDAVSADRTFVPCLFHQSATDRKRSRSHTSPSAGSRTGAVAL